MTFINTINQTPKRPQINETKSNIVERCKRVHGEREASEYLLSCLVERRLKEESKHYTSIIINSLSHLYP